MHMTEDQKGTPAKPGRRQRNPSLGVALKQAKRAGVIVSGASIEPGGKIELRFGEPETSTGNAVDRWLNARATKGN
jgi:hypothetical protein